MNRLRRIYLQIFFLLFVMISGSEVKAEEADPDYNELSVGNIFIFGKYEQDNNLENGPECIEWIVLDVEEERALLISRYGLDMKVYNESPYAQPWGRVMWETSSIRSWLNGEFYDSSFSDLEKLRIVNTNVINGYTKYSYVDGGKNTEDYIFLLSIDEAEKYFNNDGDRVCFATLYCKAQGAWTEYNGTCWWWLRSPGEPMEYASHIFVDGDIHIYGNRLSVTGGAVRPALWLKLFDDNKDSSTENYNTVVATSAPEQIEETLEETVEPVLTPEFIPEQTPDLSPKQTMEPISGETPVSSVMLFCYIGGIVLMIIVGTASVIIVFKHKRKK